MSNRFDPALVAGNCPTCGLSTSAQTGEPTPMHQENGDQSKGTCPGSGSPSQ
ncbi:hypothetical protein [Streptomyces rapamycinicus]|uniref:Uncharacterized protein n=2 Tax=Streptomyces rapamycinicus TaxID=1226757 RepID=A0A0A0NJB8_STRRN|nr:hypothetical protein [Streptomyces rapamycinicus]AGP56203.1 hypothetical protein M271_23465 [Streptomyces rapamycinicus NRRL 5491]MBB4783812.1 hypothetical protein [Streptomyces rapamycinicus]RLV80716.1 hypothetical protein D3C57_120065 [Streptomyces rapamycinicus NRRL 5491]UTO64169.1 hypothetical protein LJB45_18755 [Streptomyces rapamycinicus]UTP32124.1 hypothetical protein LIV37_23875 [Streptomyces rapamycinicus NRRL 5491]